MISERELIGLLHRADWTRLALSATVTGPAQMLETAFDSGLWISWAEKRPPFSPPPPPSPPPAWLRAHAEGAGAERKLQVAPGRRYRMTSADGTRVIGSDGEHVWLWFAEPLPPGTAVRFDRSPRPPAPLLLDPAWLLGAYRLTVAPDPAGPAGGVTVAGRAGITVEGQPRISGAPAFPGGAGRLGELLRGLPRKDRVVVVVDAELGFLLRCEFYADGASSGETALSEVTVGRPADPAVFTAPEGSFSGGGASKTERSPVEQLGLEAGKLAGGLVAGGLAATLKLTGRRRINPFATATAEPADPDRAMPGEPPLPGWAAGTDGPPVTDELLELLYRGGLDVPRFSATVPVWSDDDAVAAWVSGAVPPSARQAGFGGVGRLIDTLLGEDEETGPRTGHQVYRLRFGGWDRYRIDLDRGSSWQDGTSRRQRHSSRVPVTVACDGERTFQVRADEVTVGPARPLWDADRDLASLVDGGWLLGYRLSGGQPAVVGGRPGYRLIATGEDGPPSGFRFLSWLPDQWLPAAAVADASTGRLLRLTRYRSGQPARLLELRTLSPLGDEADFTFTPPPGLPVKESAGPPIR